MRIQKSRIPWNSPEGELEIFTARSGAPSARIRRNGGIFHLHSAVNPEDEANYFEPVELWGDLIVFLGAGFGYHVLPLLDQLSSRARVLVVDFYGHFAAHWKEHLLNRHEGPATVVSAADSDWQEGILKAVNGAARVQILRHPASYRLNPGFYDQAADLLHARDRGSAGHRNSHGALLLYGSHFLEEELKRALLRAEPGSTLFHYNSVRDPRRFEDELERAIQQDLPRCIISVNMKGLDANGVLSEIARRHGIPLVVWFVDDPHPIVPPFRSSIGKHVIALSWERAYLPWLEKQGFGRTAFLPLAGDPELFSPGEASSLAQVGFVGSAMSAPFLSKLAARFLWTPALASLAVEAARLLLAGNTAGVTAAIRQVCESRNAQLPFSDEKNGAWFCAYVIHTASMLKRKHVVGACLPLGIRTFGDPEGWRALFGSGLPTGPDVAYRSGLCSVYRSIGINVNITSCQMPAAVNQRVFDIPLCSGFVLNDNQADIEELFAPDEIATYRSVEELVDKVSWFRSHPEECLAITARARNRILACHTYDHRVAEIEKLLAH